MVEYNQQTDQLERVIYQNTSKQFANSVSVPFQRLQRRTEPGGKKGNTPGQVLSRNTLQTAVAQWQQMPQTERNEWNKKGAALTHRLPGYQTFVSHALRKAAEP